jgi:hypothetical protein
MAKDLSEGCLIREWEYSKYAKYLWKRDDTKYHKYWLFDEQLAFETDKIEDFKIIWHYDITSLIKYIADKWEIELDWEWFWTIYNHTWEQYLWKIPNIPLNLYNDEQEKTTLNLLLKLESI